MKSRLLLLTMVVAFAFSGAAYAHHSFAGTYREGETITIEGKIVQFNIRNPHSFINVEVTGTDGSKELWGGEWGSVTQLTEGGVDRFTLKVGEHILISGAPARDSLDHKILVRKVVRPATDTVEEFLWEGRLR
jgi:hypothetical protein